LWKASLYLCDYIIYNSGVIFNKDSKVVEFGAGVGLTGLICSLFIDKVMCTDLENVIKLAENNYNLNKNILNNEILFKKIDWKNYSKIFDDEENHPASPYDLNENDRNYLKSSNLLLAADVVYDDELTINFLNLLTKVMSCRENQPKSAYIGIEKRINFETKRLDSVSSCYYYFEQSMIELNDYITDEGVKFKTEILDLSLPKYMISYDRSEFLFIWKITTKIEEDI
jgi:predicted nicotinamide N-methyase